MRVVNLAQSANLCVQPFYDPQAMLMAGSVPTNDELTQLISKRFVFVVDKVFEANGNIGADFVVKFGNHFKVFRMRDTTPSSIAPLQWHVIDASLMAERETITKSAFDKRRLLSEAGATKELLENALQENPQAIAVVFRPKIKKNHDGLGLWLNLWAAAKSAGKVMGYFLA